MISVIYYRFLIKKISKIDSKSCSVVLIRLYGPAGCADWGTYLCFSSPFSSCKIKFKGGKKNRRDKEEREKREREKREGEREGYHTFICVSCVLCPLFVGCSLIRCLFVVLYLLLVEDLYGMVMQVCL
jgi:hypothetical protein